MIKKRFVLAVVAALMVLGVTAQSASALPTGNAIINHVEPSNYAIHVSQKNPYASPIYDAWPQGGRVNNAQCFKPALTSHSYWGGIYWGGSIYCFQSSNNVLTLYSGLP